ncbi:MAG: phosphoenolpyruvate carboxykinase (ATP) [Bacteroidetes bacterium]|nr:phosphoenolpyruvate carboxykinase (ATP) [Bacteroidota bacterium]
MKVWLINTGWSGEPYGVGNRMKLAYLPYDTSSHEWRFRSS